MWEGAGAFHMNTPLSWITNAQFKLILTPSSRGALQIRPGFKVGYFTPSIQSVTQWLSHLNKCYSWAWFWEVACSGVSLVIGIMLCYMNGSAWRKKKEQPELHLFHTHNLWKWMLITHRSDVRHIKQSDVGQWATFKFINVQPPYYHTVCLLSGFVLFNTRS